jgi:hypothetical protein
VGKGVLACQWIVELVRDGHVVLIVDYEAHETEWSRRISALGGPDALAGVYYVAPLTPTWTGVRGLVWAQAADIHAIAEAIRATFIVIDSIVPGCAGVDPMKPEAASQYAAALQLIARPALSLAHITKADDQRYPFGSVFWHNLARTTWSLAAGRRERAAHRDPHPSEAEQLPQPRQVHRQRYVARRAARRSAGARLHPGPGRPDHGRARRRPAHRGRARHGSE